MAQAKQKAKDIGIKVNPPEETCEDTKCPFHGSLPIRGKVFTGIVVRGRMQQSVVVEWERRAYVSKYERYEKRKTRIKAHNPPCINAQAGDRVKIVETRPLSKTISAVVVEVLERNQETEQVTS